jgi:cation diffusion facilitator CzcD-associated flavoprotein CzcO
MRNHRKAGSSGGIRRIEEAIDMSQGETAGRQLKICVIGAGASGILALITLRKHGFENLTALEKASDLGGTWWYNRYPGVACDVPSLSYRFSFAASPNWSRTNASAEEIHGYLKAVAADFGVEKYIRFNEEFVRAEYRNGKWRVEARTGFVDEFDVVISAVGVLHHPKYPDIPGLDLFGGVCTHTMKMPRDLKLDQKRVGVIGTGSTAVQLVSAVAQRVGHLTVFLRTPQWIVPIKNELISEEQKAEYRHKKDLLQQEYQRLNNELNTQFAAAVIGENPQAYAELLQACTENLKTVLDPALRAKLTPTYEMGCKRLVLAEGFYEALQRPNVEVITEKIVAIEKGGVRTSNGRLHELDILLLATGFDPHTPYGSATILGKNGLSLADAWSNGAVAYKQVAVSGFPNWFMMGGPGSPIGNFSFLLTAEHQMNYILQLVQIIASEGVRDVMPKPEAQGAFEQARRERMEHTVWASGCVSWYRDKHGNLPFWPWNYQKFAEDMKRPTRDDYVIR